jgi:hypothetical protein
MTMTSHMPSVLVNGMHSREFTAFPLSPSPEMPRDAALEQAERHDRCRESILRTGAWDGR